MARSFQIINRKGKDQMRCGISGISGGCNTENVIRHVSGFKGPKDGLAPICHRLAIFERGYTEDDWETKADEKLFKLCALKHLSLDFCQFESESGGSSETIFKGGPLVVLVIEWPEYESKCQNDTLYSRSKNVI